MGSSQETIERALRLVGTMLRDKWRLDALIGVGGMASVYSATHRNGKRAAIKLLNRDLSEGDTTRARFLREGYVANKVGHPGVVNVIDDDTSEDGRAFLVMELLEGETLKARWSRWNKRMPVEEVLLVTHAVLDVLAAAHDKGIVHRDIKPDNIFLTNDGGVKVLDFGIARLRETGEAADATRSSAMLGTPAFMAPEQARSRWEWVDARTDVWAVGATMFTSLTGQFVHNAVTVTELLVTAAMMPARPIQSIAPDLPDNVAAIIDRALAFEQAQRWPDARSMQNAIAFTLQPPEVKPLTTQPMPQVTTNPTSTRTFEGGFAASPASQPALASPMAPEASAMRTAPVVAHPPTMVGPAAPVTNTLTAPFPNPRPSAPSNVNPPTQAIATTALLTPTPGSAPISQLQAAALLQVQATPAPPSQPSHPAAFSNSQPQPLAQSQSGLMQSPFTALPVPLPTPEPPGVSTLVAAATASATLAGQKPKPKTNPLVFAAVGAVLFVGVIAAFFVVRSGSGSEDKATKETNAATPPLVTSQALVPAPPASSEPSVETASPPAAEAPVASAAPADSADVGEALQPRQTNPTKPRTPPKGTKKRDPFDKY